MEVVTFELLVEIYICWLNYAQIDFINPITFLPSWFILDSFWASQSQPFKMWLVGHSIGAMGTYASVWFFFLVFEESCTEKIRVRKNKGNCDLNGYETWINKYVKWMWFTISTRKIIQRVHLTTWSII